MSFVHKKVNRRQWSLKSLKFFEVCARHDTFSAAASEMFVTHSAVSKQIKSLEEGLGFKLFNRETSTLRLSVEGKALADHLVVLFNDLDKVIDDLTDKDLTAPLIISCEPTICLKLLIPLLYEIEQATGVTLQVLSGGGAVNFRRDAVDLAIRRNDFVVNDDLYVYTLGKEYIGPVVCRRLDSSIRARNLKANDVKQTDKTSERSTEKEFNRMNNICRIHSKTRPNAWLNWQTKSLVNNFTNDVYYEHHFSALEAVDAQQGAAMMSIHMVARLLDQNKLIAPMGFLEDGSDYVCLSLKPFEQDKRKQLICEWLRNKFNKNIDQALRINASALFTKE